MIVSHLFVRPGHGLPMAPVGQLRVDQNGVTGGVVCKPIRQLLIMPRVVLYTMSIEPGSLRENIVLDGLNIHAMPSGTVLIVGDVHIRLTIHCEPCHKVASFAPPTALMHQRGYLGQCVVPGTVRVGDSASLGPQAYEAIPYDIYERLEWYLSKHKERVPSLTLLHDIGLSPSYARALPAMLRRVQPHLAALVVFAKDTNDKFGGRPRFNADAGRDTHLWHSVLSDRHSARK